MFSDMESLEQAIHDVFDKLKEKPLIKHLNGREIIDCKKLYDPLMDSSIGYHQQPQQFRIQRFDDKTVLLHKQCSHSRFWLPTTKGNKAKK